MGSIKYENIIASITVKGQIDLEEIAEALPGAQYNPSVFPGLIYQQKSPKSVVFLFKSGKLLVTGPNSYETIEEAIDVFISKVKRSGCILIRSTPVSTKDIAASYDIGKRVNLKELAVGLGMRASYVPDKFPGVIYKASGSTVALIFETGKVVTTGTKNSQETKTVFEQILKKVTL
jgi:transcription initiation factor TFIID TATA-box-binding protein